LLRNAIIEKLDKLTYLFFLFTLAGCDFKSSEDYRKEANLLEEQKKFREAIVLLDRAVEKDPSNPSLEITQVRSQIIQKYWRLIRITALPL
jgi:tetratricopeptide (TPR) repeat protein